MLAKQAEETKKLGTLFQTLANLDFMDETGDSSSNGGHTGSSPDSSSGDSNAFTLIRPLKRGDSAGSQTGTNVRQ